MDTISVFSSFIKKDKIDKPYNSSKKIKKLINKNDKNFFIKNKIVSLSSLNDWKITKNKVFHKSGKHF